MKFQGDKPKKNKTNQTNLFLGLPWEIRRESAPR